MSNHAILLLARTPVRYTASLPFHLFTGSGTVTEMVIVLELCGPGGRRGHWEEHAMKLAPALLLAEALAGAAAADELRQPLFSTVDLDRGDARDVRLPDGG